MINEMNNEFFVSESKNIVYAYYTELVREGKRRLITINIDNVIMWHIERLNNFVNTSPMIQSPLYGSTLLESIDKIKKYYNKINDLGIFYEIGMFYVEPNTDILSIKDIKNTINTFAKYNVYYEVKILRNGQEVNLTI